MLTSPRATLGQEPPLFSRADALGAAGLSDARAQRSLPSSSGTHAWRLRAANGLNCRARSSASNLPRQDRQALQFTSSDV